MAILPAQTNRLSRSDIDFDLCKTSLWCKAVKLVKGEPVINGANPSSLMTFSFEMKAIWWFVGELKVIASGCIDKPGNTNNNSMEIQGQH